MNKLFELGRVVATPGAMKSIPQPEMVAALERHSSGDWGDLDDDDILTNNLAVEHGDRILSAYKSLDGVSFWVLTESDRSATTFLLPEEY